VIDPRLGSDRLRGMPVIAGKHRRLDAQRCQTGDRLSGLFSDRICHGDQPDGHAVAGHQHGGACLALQTGHVLLHRGYVDPGILQQTSASHAYPGTVNGRHDALATHSLKAAGLGQRQAAG